MNALLIFLALAAAPPAEYTVTVPTRKVFLLTNGPGTRTIPLSKMPAEPAHWPSFLRVLHNGEPPVDGVFNVAGKPVRPVVGFLPTSTASVSVAWDDIGGFAVSFRTPGRVTFRAVAGKWHEDVTVEVRQFPLWRGMSATDLLDSAGFPDRKVPLPDRSATLWTYKRLPEWILAMHGEPSRLGDLIHESRIDRAAANAMKSGE